ncbi:MAG: methyltransferase [Thermoanaerobaculia bacterium]
MRALELKVPPVVQFAFCAAAGYGLSRAVPALAFRLPGTTVAAGLLALAGAGIGAAGVILFVRLRTTVNPHRPENASAVVASGVYRLTRNPMYLGLLLALAAWSLYLSNAAAALALPAFVAYMNRFQIEPEERALTSKFGAPFIAYMAAVRRWC